MQSKEILELVYKVIENAKGRDIRVLDVRNISDIADYMIVASGTSSRHVSSVADRIVDELKDHGCRPMGVEGRQSGDWVLIDYGDVIAHIMRPQIRDFYNLEKLWDTSPVHSAAES